ncbi:XRE family transcriptional regulator [Parapedobacter indicus]|uniref:Phage repressor protein C, contains Cro/C1-type HTH and peptisase s24 domains n=1 Tax=Parapedobacter indicus TaxID=1477437 RepID=A0A1I3DZX0_9SPHI|nr:S24 family peptidase [Parapedobacter indicus]PPL04909.1 phage repressor protein C with HTH and peptisase S24 domain [Parapedobacter indicus]SFH92193.1 Phage repressor protein C, contains Cro/C1-type HTH and peptisase s24 domains [Parapedobacter indicus]
MTGAELKSLRIKKGLTQEMLAQLSGVPLGSIGRIEAAKNDDIKKEKVVSALKSVLMSETYAGRPQNASKEIESNQTSIPMYNFPTAASAIEIYNDPNDVKVIGHLNIPGSTRDSFALPVYGHSMYPTLENGSWCVLRPINDVQDILWGEIYYVEWGDYRMFKRILVSEKEDEVILWSDNQLEKIRDKPKYAPVNVKKERIRRLCLLTDILKKPNY